MRSLHAARARPLHVAAGALALGSTLSVTALAIAQTPPPAVTDVRLAPPPAPSVDDARVRFDQPVVVHGRLEAVTAGHRIAVQQKASRGRSWRVLETTVVRPDGSYRTTVRLRRSGPLRVVPIAVRDETGLVAGGAVAAASERPSAPRRIAVAARIVTSHRDRDVTAGTSFRVAGTVLPRTRGRRVVVEIGGQGHWQPLARARTRANGHFSARVTAQSLGSSRLRVRFTGDRRNVAARAGAGTLQAFRPTLASWYALYGNRTACGQTLGYDTLGVAHKTLPCGTLVTLRYNGREVTVPVIDRGPFVGGREWDLTGATARTLGFSGAGVVWSTR